METRDYVTAAWVALRVLLSGTRTTQSQHLFVWCRLFNSELIWLSSNVGTKRTFSHASGVKLRPCHIPQRRVMKYGLPCFVRNSGSLVCTAHKYLDKLVPFLTNLQSTSKFKREDARCWKFLRRHFFLLFLFKMTSTIGTVYHITVFSWYAFIVKSLADKDGEELPAGIFVYGGPWKYLTFLNLVSTLAVIAEIQFIMLVAGMRAEHWKSALCWCFCFSYYKWHSLDWPRWTIYNLTQSQTALWSDAKTFCFLCLPFLLARWETFFFTVFILFIQEKKRLMYMAH